jgi:hypothetical protein
MATKKKSTKTERPAEEPKEKAESKVEETGATETTDRKTELSRELKKLQEERDHARASGGFRVANIIKRINEINEELAALK